MIFVDVQGVRLTVSGDTFFLNCQLGMNGLGMKFNRNRKQWTGTASLKRLEFLANQNGAILTSEAEQAIQDFRRAAEKRATYMASRAKGVA